MTIVPWAAISSAASTGNAVGSSAGAALVLLGGVCIGSFVWFSILSAAVAWSRRRVGPRLVAAIDAVSALAIVGFAGLLGYRTLRDAWAVPPSRDVNALRACRSGAGGGTHRRPSLAAPGR